MSNITDSRLIVLSCLLIPFMLLCFISQARAGIALETYWPLYGGDQKVFSYGAESLAMTVSDYEVNQYKIQYQTATDMGYEIHQIGSDKIQVVLAKTGYILISFNPYINLLNESVVLNGGTITTQTTVTQRYAGSYPATFTVVVEMAGAVTVPAGTFTNCRSISVQKVATIPGEGTVNVSFMTAILAPGVGIIRKLVSPGTWAELVSGTVHGIDVTKTTIAPTIASSSPLPTATVGVAYNQALAATDGAMPYTWSVSSGTLPAGLSLSSVGILSGTPSVATNTGFTVQVTGSNGLFSRKVFSIAVNNQFSSLDLSLSGSGSGSVNSNPSGSISCTWPPQAGKCSTSQTTGTSLTLIASHGGDSSFGGWGGSCSLCTGLTCLLTIDADKSCTAIFNILPLVRIPGPAYYASIATAYSHLVAGSHAAMQVQAVELTGDVDLLSNIELDLQGGYDSGFTGSTGFTTLHGTVSIGNGSLTLDRIVIK
ncbi:MAG: putative Ig domain-containing protein [Desulfuromonadales bacterium]|nr:putative Ig domain-containing protein [Desulfuromonadales bacterium]